MTIDYGDISYEAFIKAREDGDLTIDGAVDRMHWNAISSSRRREVMNHLTNPKAVADDMPREDCNFDTTYEIYLQARRQAMRPEGFDRSKENWEAQLNVERKEILNELHKAAKRNEEVELDSLDDVNRGSNWGTWA